MAEFNTISKNLCRNIFDCEMNSGLSVLTFLRGGADVGYFLNRLFIRFIEIIYLQGGKHDL